MKKDLGNPLRNLVGYNDTPKPPIEKILANILDGMAEFGGTYWSPVKTQDEDGNATSYSLYLKQCDGACGRVWNITIKDKDVVNWLVNYLNERTA